MVSSPTGFCQNRQDAAVLWREMHRFPDFLNHRSCSLVDQREGLVFHILGNDAADTHLFLGGGMVRKQKTYPTRVWVTLDKFLRLVFYYTSFKQGPYADRIMLI